MIMMSNVKSANKICVQLINNESKIDSSRMFIAGFLTTRPIKELYPTRSIKELYPTVSRNSWKVCKVYWRYACL